MKKLTITDEIKKVSSEELEAMATDLDLNLPEDYLSFMTQYGGVELLESQFAGKYFISFTLPITSKRNACIRNILEGYKVDMNTANWLPFALDQGGWVFCYSVAPETMGQIFIDRFDSGDDPRHKFLAKSLTEFVDGLEEEE
jgi:hypothetical protein